MHYSVSNKQKSSTVPSRECNNCISALVVQLVAEICETSKVLKLKNSNLSLTSFSTPFLISPKCPTMSPHQEAIASSTSSLILGLKEFTTMVEAPTWPWSSLSCFEATPTIQVCTCMQLWHTEATVCTTGTNNESTSRFMTAVLISNSNCCARCIHNK